MKKFGDYEVVPRVPNKWKGVMELYKEDSWFYQEFVDTPPEHYDIDFPNGYSASIIRDPFSYGGKKGLWEMAIIRGGQLDYSTPITDDVLGYLDEQKVALYLGRIERLPKAPDEPPPPLKLPSEVWKEYQESLKENENESENK